MRSSESSNQPIRCTANAMTRGSVSGCRYHVLPIDDWLFKKVRPNEAREIMEAIEAKDRTRLTNNPGVCHLSTRALPQELAQGGEHGNAAARELVAQGGVVGDEARDRRMEDATSAAGACVPAAGAPEAAAPQPGAGSPLQAPGANPASGPSPASHTENGIGSSIPPATASNDRPRTTAASKGDSRTAPYPSSRVRRLSNRARLRDIIASSTARGMTMPWPRAMRASSPLPPNRRVKDPGSPISPVTMNTGGFISGYWKLVDLVRFPQ